MPLAARRLTTAGLFLSGVTFLPMAISIHAVFLLMIGDSRSGISAKIGWMIFFSGNSGESP